MTPKYRKLDSDDYWDYQSIPMLPFKRQKYSSDRAVSKIIYSKKEEDLDLGLQLRRARQLAYIEPWFQSVLPEKLKGRLYLSSLGRKFWVVTAKDSLSASNFKYYQKEIRKTLENILNLISDKEWEIPIFEKRRIVNEFKVEVRPSRGDVDRLIEIPVEPIIQMPVRSNKTLLEDATKRSIDDILASMMDSAKKNGR